jgi:tRNA A-37 threonylcarbamoyl transferase component Bud32
LATPQIGDEFAGYRIEALIGRGGMGVVYRAEQERPHRRVALKLLASELSADESFRERFIRESDLAAAIEHPNIIPIYNAGEVDGQLYIAMRYVEGSDLKALIQREGRMDPPRALSLVGQLGSALDVAHGRGLVHRDVKPQNMLIASGEGVESSDHVYLTDFGLTKHTASRSGLTAAGHFVGTIDYVSPEQIEGKTLDPRTDVYSLGCVLYECLTGTLPYERDSEVSVMYAHISDPPPAVSTARVDISPGIDAVIAKALAKSPGDRFSTCKELVAAAREELGIVSSERPRTVASPGGTVVAPAGAVGAAPGVRPAGNTVADVAVPVAQMSDPNALQGMGSDPSAQSWQGPDAQQGGWQGGPPPGGGQPGQQGQPGPSGPGWQQGPGPSDPTWQQPPGGGGGGWQGGPPPGGPSGPGWQQGGPPSKGPNKGLLYGIIGGLVLIAVVVGAFLFLGGDDEEPEPQPSPEPVASLTAPPSPSPVPSFSPVISPSPVVSPIPADVFPAEGDEKFLFNRIPTDIRPTCERQVEEFMPAGARVGITCDTPGQGADFVSYYKYATGESMNRQYAISVTIAEATRDTGTCPTDIPAETSFTRSGQGTVGRLVCYDFQGSGRIEWTNDKLFVYSEAVRLDGMDAELNDFWTSAGPTTFPQ